MYAKSLEATQGSYVLTGDADSDTLTIDKDLTVAAGSTLEFNATVDVGGKLVLNAAGDSKGTVKVGGTMDVTEILTGGGTLEVADKGALTLTRALNSASFTGTLTMSGGTATLSEGGTLGTLSMSGGALTIGGTDKTWRSRVSAVVAAALPAAR